MKVALYARVSTDDKEQDPERQFMQLRKYVELHQHECLGEYQDKISGDTPPVSREGFNALMVVKPEGVIVYQIDRLSREHPSKVLRFLGEMKDKGIAIISITEPAFNMDGEFADLIRYIITWFNNWYLANLKRNVKTGIEKARAQGKQIGRKKAEFNKFRAYELLTNEKKSQRFVSKELGVSLATINRFKKVIEKEPSLFINKP